MFLKALNRRAQLTLFVYLALIVTTIAAFGQVWNFEFINYDDDRYIYQNVYVLKGLTPDGIISAFTIPQNGNWLPLTWLSFMLDCHLFDLNPGRMHLENLLLHIVNTLLLFAVFKKMTDSLWPSAFVAAAFALHPMHVESVAWVIERKDILSTLFFMFTLTTYVCYVKNRNLASYLLTILLFVFGLLAKPMIATLPFVLLLLDYWPLERFAAADSLKTADGKSGNPAAITGRRRNLYQIIIEKVPFFALAAVSGTITFIAQKGCGAVPDINTISLQSRIANSFLSYTRYIGKMFWPQNLAVFYPRDIHRFPFWQIAACALLLLGISVFVISFRRKQKYLLVGWFWFLGTLIPVIGLVQSGQQAYADRYTYIPYIGLFIMIAWGSREVFLKCPYLKTALGITAAIVLSTLGIVTYKQVGYWKNSFTLFSHTLKATQNNYIAHICLGHYFTFNNDAASAIEHCKKGLEIKPNNEYALNILGYLMIGEGNFEKATEYLRRAIKGKTDLAGSHYHLANALAAQGRFDEAIDQLRTVLQLKPDRPKPMNNLAFLIAACPEIKGRDVNEAVCLARRACELTNYRNTTFLDTLALAYSSAGKVSEAADTAKAAINIDPNLASSRGVLETSVLSGGYLNKATIHIKRNLEIDPNNIGEKNNLAWILAINPDPNI